MTKNKRLRMVDKGLLEVNGEPLIERIIKQLHEVGIQEIYVVVGFMKEKYEFDLHLLQPFSRYDKMVKINGDNETV